MIDVKIASMSHSLLARAWRSVMPGPRAPPRPPHGAALRLQQHGYAWEDELAPLHADSARAHFEAENHYCRRTLEPWQRFQTTLANEMASRSRFSSVSEPAIVGGHAYVRVVCEDGSCTDLRRKILADGRQGPDEVLLDHQALSQQLGAPDAAVGPLRLSPCGGRVVFLVDACGDERCDAYVVELESGRGWGMPMRVLQDVRAAEWAHCAGDAPRLWYTTANSMHRPAALFDHELGSRRAADTLLLEEEEERYFLDVTVTKDAQAIVVSRCGRPPTRAPCASRLTAGDSASPKSTRRCGWWGLSMQRQRAPLGCHRHCCRAANAWRSSSIAAASCLR